MNKVHYCYHTDLVTQNFMCSMASLPSQHRPNTHFHIPLLVLSSTENHKQLNIISSRRGQGTLLVLRLLSLFLDRKVRRAGLSFILLWKGIHMRHLDLWGSPWSHKENTEKTKDVGQHIMKLPNKNRFYLF